MMRTRRGWMGALVGAVLLVAGPAFAQVSIDVAQNVEVVDGEAAVTVSLTAGGAMVGGMQNDIVFDSTVVDLSAANRCRINADIGLFPGGSSCLDDPSIGPCKNLSSVIQTCPGGDGCPDGATSDIKVYRGIIAATAAPNSNAIPDGALYTCTFDVVDAGGLPTTLANSNIVVSDPSGTRLDSLGTDGSIGEGGDPTPTPTMGGGDCVVPDAPTPPAGGAAIVVGSETDADETAVIEVSLATDGASVGGMQTDIVFDSTVVDLSAANRCQINSAIGLFPGGESCLDDPSIGPCKNLSSVIQTCPGGDGCPDGATSDIKVYRGIIAATAAPNSNEIPEGLLITCTFDVVDAAGLPTTLAGSNQVVSDPSGTRVDSVVGDGVVCSGGVIVTPTPTEDIPPTDTPTQVPPTNTAVPPTNTAVPPTQTATATPDDGGVCTSTTANAAAQGDVALNLTGDVTCFPESGGTVEIGSANPFNVGYTERVGNQLFLSSPLSQAVAAGTAVTLVSGAGDDDDGCHINPRPSNSSAWMLLIPALGALVMRRKRW